MHHPPPVVAASTVLLSTVPFAIERITSRNGDVSLERRGWAWVTEAGVGTLAYSGKLMRASVTHALPQWNPVIVTASSYSSRQNLPMAGLSTGMFGHRYSVGVRLEPIVRPDRV